VSDSDGTPTLLIVDDEPRILSALHRCLRREGWRILVTSDSDEALRWLAAEPIDALLSDHKMRGASGLDLLESAVGIQPGTARFLISGWPDEIPAGRLAAIGVRALIPKPWDDATLRALLREAVGS
jgi:response regulator RpfG family c-di-GMP phosphodiesterase